MKIEEIYEVRGRGSVFIVELEDMSQLTVHVGDYLKVAGVDYKITGIEMAAYSKRVGFVLNPNELARHTIKVGDDVQFVSEETVKLNGTSKIRKPGLFFKDGRIIMYEYNTLALMTGYGEPVDVTEEVAKALLPYIQKAEQK